MKRLVATLYLVLLINTASAQSLHIESLSKLTTASLQTPDWNDSIEVKRQIDDLLGRRINIPQQDSIILNAISICNRSGLINWEIRLLNFWSQLKVSQDNIDLAYASIQRAIGLTKTSESLIRSVDYRDAIMQMALVQFYRNNFDSSIYWCRKGKLLAREEKDLFNEAVMTAEEACGISVKNGDIKLIDSLFRYAYQLSQQTVTRHDDAMVLHNYAYFQKAYPVQNLKASLELLLSIQDFSNDKELEKNAAIPYRRSPFYFRGTHMLMLRELAYGYLYLGDFEQAAYYMEQCSKKQVASKNFAYLPRILIEQTYFETFRQPVSRIKMLYDSVVKLTVQYHEKDELPTSYLYYVKGWLAEQRSDWRAAIQQYQKAILYSEFGVNENQIALFRTFIKNKDIFHADSMCSTINRHIDSTIIQYHRIYFYKELPAYYRLKKNELQALQAHLDYYQLKDSMAGISSYLIASRFEKQFKTKEKDRLLLLAEKEKILNQQQLSLRNKQTLILAGGFLLLSLATALLIRTYRLKKKRAAALEQKNNQIETLIRELHHRVKNNLQVVSGLLSLQSGRMEEGKARDAMDEGRTRVDAMAMIHQRLYMDKDLASVDIEDYLQNLSLSLANSFGYDEQHVRIRVTLPKRSLHIDMAIPIGLIVNELVTNAFKHAFSNTSDPQINVSLEKGVNGNIELKITDNGKGILANPDTSRSFGMKLVHTLVDQLNGTLQMKQDNGTIYNIQIRA